MRKPFCPTIMQARRAGAAQGKEGGAAIAGDARGRRGIERQASRPSRPGTPRHKAAAPEAWRPGKTEADRPSPENRSRRDASAASCSACISGPVIGVRRMPAERQDARRSRRKENPPRGDGRSHPEASDVSAPAHDEIRQIGKAQSPPAATSAHGDSRPRCSSAMAHLGRAADCGVLNRTELALSYRSCAKRPP